MLFCNYGFAQSSKPTVFKNGIQGNSNIFDSDGNNLGNLSSLISTANNAIPKSQIGVANGVAPLDANKMMPSAVSGSIDNGLVTSTNPRILSSRNVDIPDLNDYVTAWDGSDTFKDNLAKYFSQGVRYVAPLPCNTALPLPDSNGYVDIGNITGKFFLDVCGAQRVGGGYYNYVDYAIGNNNPTMTSYGGQLFVNRYNSGVVNGDGLFSVNLTQATTTSTNQWPGGIDPDMPNFSVHITMPEYGADGNETTGSPVGFIANVDNYSHRNWAVQAQGMKVFCTNHTVGGSCWGYSTNINDISGRSAQTWNLINENDSESNGPENPAAFYNPKLSYRYMDYASAIANVPAGWSANTNYSVGAQVLVNDSDGNARILIASVSGKSGANSFTSSNIEGNTITDGNVTWTIGTTRDTTIGVVHFINNDGNGSPSSMASYNFGFSGNARINNSMFDASHAIYGPKAAAFRMPRDVSFSLCDLPGATSDADINNCTLAYSSLYGEFVYTAYGKQIFIAGNDGTFSVPNNIITGDAHINSSLYLGRRSKAQILALSSPQEGQKVFDTDDHEEVTYRCTTATTCGWAPVQYGSFISN